IVLALACPLVPVFGWHAALYWIAVAFGPLSLGLLGLALAWAIAPLTDRQWRWLAPVLAGISPGILGYGLPGVLHHHVLLALIVTMTTGWAGRASMRCAWAGWFAGAWAGTGIWLSPETMPFSLMVFGALGLAWLLYPDVPQLGRSLRDFGSSFLLVILFALAVDPPLTGYGAVEIDRLSIVYGVLGFVVCAIGWVLWALGRLHLSMCPRALGGAGAMLAGLGAWVSVFPSVLRGPDGLMDRETARAFFTGITEVMPAVTVDQVLFYLWTGVLGAGIAAALAWWRRSLLWGYVALCGVAAVALGALHLRFSTYSEVLGAAMLPAALAIPSTLGLPEMKQAAARLSLCLLFFAPQAGNWFRATDAAAKGAFDCSVRDLGPLLSAYSGQVVLADVNDTPELLYRTGVLTVGSLYHRNSGAFMRLRAAWRSGPSGTVPDAVRATGASLLLFCPSKRRSSLVFDLPADTLLDRLNRGEPPRWLTKIGEHASSGHVLYRITE
ncbi:MAG: hypothetical protein JOY71_01330, partial [Acetobacteraceae bacterium]|nr:hypothetical protein [Acetobacteraceae bacterium]